jgi:hypothetical protein
MEAMTEIRLDQPTLLEAAVGKLINFVPELLAAKGWDTKTFVAHCMLAGLSQDTAYRLARGDINFTTVTLQVVAEILDQPSISKVIDFAAEQ